MKYVFKHCNMKAEQRHFIYEKSIPFWHLSQEDTEDIFKQTKEYNKNEAVIRSKIKLIKCFRSPVYAKRSDFERKIFHKIVIMIDTLGETRCKNGTIYQRWETGNQRLQKTILKIELI